MATATITAKTRKRLGFKTPYQYKIEVEKRWQAAALDLSLETRRDFIRLFKKGGKSLKEMTESLSISMDAAYGILKLNIKRHVSETLNDPENCV